MSAKRIDDKLLSRRKYLSNDAIVNFVTGNKIMTACLDSILNILKNEKYKEKKCPFNAEIALNLDKVECLIKKGGERAKTVDFVVCLEKDWLLLVEAKLEVSNVENIARNIQGKIENSKNILCSCDNYIHSEESVVILLNNNKYQEQSNKLRRLLIGKNINIKPFNVRSFYEHFFLKD